MKKLIFPICVLALLGAWAYFAARPAPLAVDVVRAETGPMVVTVDEEGETRSHDRYVITAPVAGRMKRIELHEGDKVERGRVITQLVPLPLDARASGEARSRVDAATARKREAESDVQKVQILLDQARRERARTEALWKSGDIPQATVDRARDTQLSAESALEAARFRAEAAGRDVEVARAALISAGSGAPGADPVPVVSPVRGTVIGIPERSDRIVERGAPLLLLGDSRHLEAVIDVLSADAVRIQPGSEALLRQWGGPPLPAKVRTVEPYAFTKVSALGIEEKRVKVVLDFVNPPERLGDGYRLEASITVWSAPKTLRVPITALFRTGSNWSAFIVEGGLARLRQVQVGHQNSAAAEITGGLKDGEVLVDRPPRSLEDGMTVKARGQ